MRLWLAIVIVFGAVSPAKAQSPDELRIYLADAVRLVGKCPAIRLDERVARQIAAMAGINDAQAQMRLLNEQQLALSDTIKPPLPPAAQAKPPSPGDTVEPPDTAAPAPIQPSPCEEAVALYGPDGTRLAGLVVSRQ